MLLIEIPYQRFSESWYILTALSKSWQPNMKHVEPVVKVFPQLLLEQCVLDYR